MSLLERLFPLRRRIVHYERLRPNASLATLAFNIRFSSAGTILQDNLTKAVWKNGAVSTSGSRILGGETVRISSISVSASVDGGFNITGIDVMLEPEGDLSFVTGAPKSAQSDQPNQPAPSFESRRFYGEEAVMNLGSLRDLDNIFEITIRASGSGTITADCTVHFQILRYQKGAVILGR